MNFFRTIGNSIYSPQFYLNLANNSFKRSIGYFLLLILLLTVVRLITLLNPLLIEVPTFLQRTVQDITACYPNDLEIKITNGQVSTNVTEPYFVSSCGTLKDPNKKFLVIDTQTPFSPTKFDEYKTGIWITKDSVVIKMNNDETRANSLARVKDFKLTKQSVNSLSNMIIPWLKFVGPILTLLAFVGIYLSYDFRLIHLLIVAALIFVLGKIFKQELSYGQSYKVGLYAITLGLIIELVMGLTAGWTHFYGFPFMVTILTLAVVLVNLIWPKKEV